MMMNWKHGEEKQGENEEASKQDHFHMRKKAKTLCELPR